jgi:glutamate-1-semialdehyde 2,1-aminomutase
VRNFEEAKATDTSRFARLHRAMLERGIYLAPSSYEAGFTSLAHSDADVDATISAFQEVFALIA